MSVDRPADGCIEKPGTGKQPAGDYDLLPYISMPVVYSQPARLAALAAIHGLTAPAAVSARVLELGCASGGNIIPLAARFPKASFLGLDISRRHVETGCRRIESLGLRNIEIRQADITAAGLADERFDYVVCHGVYSWVPEAVQASIFGLCREHLTRAGMAVISFNVLPGWHLRNVIRSICLRYGGQEGTPLDRVAKVRTILDEIAGTASDTDPYGHVIRSEAARLAKQPASYILGEFLAADNAPCTFQEFVERAGKFGLSYLSESDVPSTAPETVAPHAAARIRALAGRDDHALQEYIDVFSGRTFRRSVLIRTEHAASKSAPGPDGLQMLHVSSALRPSLAQGNGQAATFIDHRGRTITVGHPAVRDALTRLGAQFPATLPLAELSNASEDEPRVREALFRLVATGRVTASSLPLVCGTVEAPRPRVWSLARAEAATIQPWVTSLRHTAVMLNPVLRLLMPFMDGAHDRDQLAERLLEAQRAGTIDLAAGDDSGEASTIETLAAGAVTRAIAYLAVNALLEPD